MDNLFTKTCPHCGKEFETKYSFQKYCGFDCQFEVNRIRGNQPRAKKTKRKSRKINEITPISEIIKRAEALGLSYGMYVATRGIK